VNALFPWIDRALHIRTLARALLVLAPPIAAALGTGDPLWMHAALVTVSVFIATEQTGLAPLGVALHGLAVVAGFLILLAAWPFPFAFAVVAAVMAAGAILLTAKGHKLRTLGNFTFIPALYLGIELGEPGSGFVLARGMAFLPYAVLAVLPVLTLSAMEHGGELEPYIHRVGHFRHLRRRGADHGTAVPCIEAAIAAALAVVAAALLVEWRNLPHAQWAVWSAASVVTGEVATAKRKLADRMLGVLVGVPIGVACALAVPHATVFLRLAEIGIVLTLVAFRVYRVGFGARCACIAFALTFAGKWAETADRVANVMAGGSIGLAFVFAAHAVAMAMREHLSIADREHRPIACRFATFRLQVTALRGPKIRKSSR